MTDEAGHSEIIRGLHWKLPKNTRHGTAGSLHFGTVKTVGHCTICNRLFDTS